MRVLFFIFLLSPAFSFAHSKFYEEQVAPTLQRATDATSISILLYGAGVTAASTSQDHEMHDTWGDHQKMSADVSQYGDDFGKYGAALIIGLTQYLFDHDNGASSIRGTAFTALITTSIKLMGLRHRPNGSKSVHSFPSGHTSDAFSIATSLTYAYGWKAAVVMYPIATFVGLSRISDNAHWFSDVVAGAVIGVYGARAAYFRASDQKRAWFVVPTVVGTNAYGVMWDYRF